MSMFFTDDIIESSATQLDIITDLEDQKSKLHQAAHINGERKTKTLTLMTIMETTNKSMTWKIIKVIFHMTHRQSKMNHKIIKMDAKTAR